MKRLITILLFSVSVASAQTAKTRAALYTEIDTSLASGGQITAAQLRAVLKNVTASSQNGLTDGTAALASDLTSGLATKQAADDDLTIYAGITPSSNIQSFLGAADYSAARGLLGLTIGTNVQAFSANLSSFATVTPSANGLSLVSAANYAAMRALLDIEPGTDFLAYPTGTPTGSKFLRDDNSWQTITGGGDALVANPLSQFASTTSAQLRGVLSDESGDGAILTTTGSAANLTSFPTLNQNTTGSAASLTTPRTINGTSFDGTANIAISASNITTGTLPAGQLPALTGDITSSAGSASTTLATVNSNVGTFGNATTVPAVTVNAKGLVTGVTNVTITAGSGNVTNNATLTSGNIVIGGGTSVVGTSNITVTGGNQITLGSINATTANITAISGVTAHGQLLIGNNTSGNFTKSTLTAGNGISITNGAGSITINATATGTNTGDQNVFPNIVVSGQDTVTANSTTANLTLVAGSGMTITTNNTTKTVTLVSSGGSGAETGDVKFILDSASVPSGWGLTGVNGIPAFTSPDADYKAVIKMAGTVATPTFSPAPGEVADGSTITFLSDTSGVTFMATTNGTDPSRSVGTAGSSMVISGNTTYEVMAYKDGVYLKDSAIATGAFTIAASGPTLVETIDFDSIADGALLSGETGWDLDGVFDQIKVSNTSGTQGFAYSGTTNALRTIRRTTTVNANHSAEMELVVSGTSGNIGFVLRKPSGSDDGYVVRYDGATLYFHVRTAGSDSTGLNWSRTYASGDKVRASAVGTGSATRIVIEENIAGAGWTSVQSSYDPGTYYDGGFIGMWGYGTSSTVGVTVLKLYNE